jgi:hypothetical protein
MVLLVQRLQSLARDVRINLGGRDVGVSQQELDDTQIRPAVQEVRRKGVPQRMRRERA